MKTLLALLLLISFNAYSDAEWGKFCSNINQEFRELMERYNNEKIELQDIRELMEDISDEDSELYNNEEYKRLVIRYNRITELRSDILSKLESYAIIRDSFCKN